MPCRIFEDNIMEFIKKLLEGQELLLQAMKEINDKVTVDTVNTTSTFYEALEGFPLETIEQFHDFESESKENERNKLVNIALNPLRN